MDVVVRLHGGELIYFKLDLNSQLNKYQEQKEMGATITSLSLSTISFQALTAVPTSICITKIFDLSINKNNETLFVNISLAHGILLRTVLDSVNNQLTNTRTQKTSVIVLSSRTWLNYTFQNLLNFGPLIYDALDNMHSFSAKLCPEGLIGIVGSSLQIFTIPRLSAKVKQDPMPLAYTPRKILLNPATKHVITVESKHRTMALDVQVARFALQKAHKTVYNIFDDPILAACLTHAMVIAVLRARAQSSLLQPACASSSAPGARSSVSSVLAFVVKAGLLSLRLGASAAAPVLLAFPGVLDVEASAFAAVTALWIVDH
ncbi:hypothetical protein PtA15_15A465 [Puccinia triticina]|uniref:RSE1/DDB1/CPSF1 second beta-propeller domain-containing protein n=1 Tax=Puccinia triticina TaxID=208348 RepID=A0ABY7D373_9BASI|nr:uncharacterized protein PtA15_15A465 [Puccinia triticina]WAQ92069.1 hypothetical protein PtA15_15A465 [Puccinia triticina]